jgi:hypothetical protein
MTVMPLSLPVLEPSVLGGGAVQISAVQLDQTLPGQLTQPGIEGQRPLP